MRAMRIKVMLEINQLCLQVCRGPEQHPIQVLTPDRSDQPFDKGMRQRHARNRFDFGDSEYSKIGLPLVESI